MVVTEFGGPDVLVERELPDPRPGPGEVVLDVAVVDTLWLDTAVRRGEARDFHPSRPPYVPGNGVAGTLDGRPVVAHTGGAGAYASRVVVPAARPVPVPDGVDLLTAAALAHDGATALALFDVTGVGPGDAVVVVGASGGLGLLSVQLAAARAASVVAVAGGAKAARVAALGVPVVGPDELGRAGAATVVLDNVGGAVGEAAFGLLADGGRFSAHGTPSGRFAAVDRVAAARRGITVTGIEAVQLGEEGMRRWTAAALGEAAAGRLRPVVGRTYPLAEAAAAHAAIEARATFGKTLLTV
jgi:NADPH:quinone reductase